MLLEWSLDGPHLRLRRFALGAHEFLRPTFAGALTAGQALPRAGWLTDPAPSEEPVVVPRDAVEHDASETGNPLLLAIVHGPGAGTLLGMRDFSATEVEADATRLTATLAHADLGLRLDVEVRIADGLSHWSIRVTSDVDREVEAAYPLFARACGGSPATDAVYVPQGSGCVLKNLLEEEYGAAAGGDHAPPCDDGPIASPFMIFQGHTLGFFLIDENESDRDDAGTHACRRGFVIANRRILSAQADDTPHGGPAVGLVHLAALTAGRPFPLGPTVVGAHRGGWKAAGLYARQRRRATIVPAPLPVWFARTTLLIDDTLERPVALAARAGSAPNEAASPGASLFRITGYPRGSGGRIGRDTLGHDALAIVFQNAGEPESFRNAVAELHRRGERVVLRIEMPIVSKRSDPGRSPDVARWALMERDGSHPGHTEGSWILCPACPEYQEWLAEACAEAIERTGVEGVVVGSAAAERRRCFNPEHRHVTPDVWSRGMRQSFRAIVDACRSVRPSAIVLTEGCGDLIRESAHGFIAHSHAWTDGRFEAPVTRFVHPEMRAFESWDDGPERAVRSHLLNFVSGQAIHAPGPLGDEMTAHVRRTRDLHGAYPEIPNGEMIPEEVKTDPPILVAHAFGTPMRAILAVANLSAEPAGGAVWVPGMGSLLYDRLDGAHVPLAGGLAWLDLPGNAQVAYELR